MVFAIAAWGMSAERTTDTVKQQWSLHLYLLLLIQRKSDGGVECEQLREAGEWELAHACDECRTASYDGQPDVGCTATTPTVNTTSGS